MDYPKFRAMAKFISNINDWIGKGASLLIIPMMAFMVIEVVMRYCFNRPTVWAHEISAMLYAVYFLIGGAYLMRWNGHINVEILYGNLSQRTRATVDCFTWLFFYIFCGTIVWKGIPYAWDAMMNLERSNTVLAVPTWPVKILIPIVAILFLLQGLVRTIECLVFAFTGREFHFSVENMEGNQ